MGAGWVSSSPCRRTAGRIQLLGRGRSRLWVRARGAPILWSKDRTGSDACQRSHISPWENFLGRKAILISRNACFLWAWAAAGWICFSWQYILKRFRNDLVMGSGNQNEAAQQVSSRAGLCPSEAFCSYLYFASREKL